MNNDKNEKLFHIIFVIIIILAIITRFYNLGNRSLSHDESIHLYYSYLFSIGQGYSHTPISHGPLQFHIIAFLFFLFNSSDFLGRVPSAIFNILAIVLLIKWRPYLGSIGTIIAAILVTFSPTILFYGRYARNESFVIFLTLFTLYVILRYLESKKSKYLILFTISTALHFTVKETVFIFLAEVLLFLFILIFQYIRLSIWYRKGYKFYFYTFFTISVVLLSFSILQTIFSFSLLSNWNFDKYFLSIGVISIFISVVILLIGFGWNKLKEIPALDLFILTITFILPQLSPFPVTWLGWNPLDYHFVWPGWNLNLIFSQGPSKIGIVFLALCISSLILGYYWSKKAWLKYALIFWGIYFLFYTSFMSNLPGFFSGSIGSLGYWLEQQSVHRGNQPGYYYLLIQLPFYEYVPLLGMFPAIILVRSQRLFSTSQIPSLSIDSRSTQLPHKPNIFIPLLIWLTITSLAAYSIAGEKMPWLTVHIVLPMILLTSWCLGKYLEMVISNNSPNHKTRIALAVSLILLIFIRCIFFVLEIYPTPQVDINSLLSSANDVFLYVFLFLFSILLLNARLRERIQPKFLMKVALLSIFSILEIITIRTSIRASFINSGNSKEYIVYAHGSDGIKAMVHLIENISKGIGSNLNISLAYDAGGETQGVSWPIKWYLREYPNAQSFLSVNSVLQSADIIIADPQSFEDLQILLSKTHYDFDTLRMVWPNQDYFDLDSLDLEKIYNDPILRYAIFRIWYDTDYSLYSEYYNHDSFHLNNWYPSDKMRIFINREIAEKYWEFNIQSK